MFYELVKIIVLLGAKAYFRRITIINAHKVPVDKPVLLLPNHPNAFLDAIVSSIWLKQQVNFLVRSDVFNTSLKKWFLAQLNNYPIYRIQEGVENLKKNEETFRTCRELFHQKKTILIFPEGICIREKRLRKLKKGAARIAFGSEEASNFSLDLQLLPVGVNYSRFGSMGGKLTITYGDPISLKDYASAYQTEKAKTINELTTDIEERMKELLVIVPSENEDEVFDQIQEMNPERDPVRAFEFEKKAGDRLKELKENHPGLFAELVERVISYKELLSSLKLKDTVLREQRPSILKTIIFVLFSPLVLLGLIISSVPHRLAVKLSGKTVGKDEFFDSVNMIGGTFIFIFFYLFLTLLYGWADGERYHSMIFFFSLFILSALGLWGLRMFKRLKGFSKFNALPAEEKVTLNDTRLRILEILQRPL